MFKYFLLLLFVIIVALGVWQLKDKTPHTLQAHTLTSIDVSHNEKTIQKYKKETNTKTTSSKDTQSSSNQKLLKKRESQEKILYESLSLEEAKLNTSPRKNITPIGAIRITQNISTLQKGDRFTLPNIEGEDYTLTVKSTYANPDGSTSITAQYEDEGITYTTTITQSPTSNYINLSTANGLYEAETNHNTGYIYRTNDIRKQMQDTSTNDFTILPIPTQKSR